jgi:hypothetical protein
MASRNADCVRGGVRFSSSARTTCANSGTGDEVEAVLVGVPDARAGDVGRQQVGGGLDPVEGPAERAGERAGERGLAAAGDVLDQRVAAGEQGARDQLDGAVPAVHDLLDVPDDPLGERREAVPCGRGDSGGRQGRARHVLLRASGRCRARPALMASARAALLTAAPVNRLARPVPAREHLSSS